MYRNFEEVLAKAKSMEGTKISVAAAADLEVLEAVKEASELGLADLVLVGDKTKIDEEIAASINFRSYQTFCGGRTERSGICQKGSGVRQHKTGENAHEGHDRNGRLSEGCSGQGDRPENRKAFKSRGRDKVAEVRQALLSHRRSHVCCSDASG